MKEHNFWIMNRFGEKLETIARVPDGDKKFPTIVFVSGIGATLHETNNSFDEISNRLIDHGFAIVQFSFSGRGKSEGNYNEMTQLRQGQQVEDVLAWVKKQPFVDISRIGIFALSFGVASTLASDVSSIKSVLFLSGVYFPLQRMIAMFIEKGEYHPDGISWRKQRDGSIFHVRPEFWNVLKAFDSKIACSSIRSPVCVLHGDHDPKIPVSDVQQAFAYFPSKKKEMKIYRGGDHGITDVPRPTREEFLQDVVRWFGKTL